jgi:formyl-CoA transferase
VGVGIADVMCGMYACVGILAALRHRDATGEGQHIDLALVDAQMAWLINEGTNYLASGVAPVRRGNAHPNICPYDVFACADGHVILAVGNDGQFRRMAQALDAPDLVADPRFATNPDRLRHREVLGGRITDLLSPLPRDEIIARLNAVGVPVGPIQTVPEALASDQARARGAVVSVPRADVEGGEVRVLGNPLKLSRTPVRMRHAPPRLGQDGADILAHLRNLHAGRSSPG